MREARKAAEAREVTRILHSPELRLRRPEQLRGRALGEATLPAQPGHGRGDLPREGVRGGGLRDRGW